MRENKGARFQTHLNENALEISEVARLFPWAQDYLAVYERFGLGGRGAVMAHNVHPGDSELERLAGSETSVSHCPCSNGALGSGVVRQVDQHASGKPCARRLAYQAALVEEVLEHLVGLQLDGIGLVHLPPELLVALEAGGEAGFGEAGRGLRHGGQSTPRKSDPARRYLILTNEL